MPCAEIAGLFPCHQRAVAQRSPRGRRPPPCEAICLPARSAYKEGHCRPGSDQYRPRFSDAQWLSMPSSTCPFPQQRAFEFAASRAGAIGTTGVFAYHPSAERLKPSQEQILCSVDISIRLRVRCLSYARLRSDRPISFRCTLHSVQYR